MSNTKEQILQEYIEGLVLEAIGSKPNPYGYLSKTKTPPGQFKWDPEQQASYAALKQAQHKAEIEKGQSQPKQQPAVPQPQGQISSEPKTNPEINVGKKQQYLDKIAQINKLLTRADSEELQQILDMLKSKGIF